MIAVVKPRCRARVEAAPTFEELLPGIEQRVQFAFRDSPASEREELIAETVANAFCAYQRLVERGKCSIPTPLIWRKRCSGCRSCTARK